MFSPGPFRVTVGYPFIIVSVMAVTPWCRWTQVRFRGIAFFSSFFSLSPSLIFVLLYPFSPAFLLFYFLVFFSHSFSFFFFFLFPFFLPLSVAFLSLFPSFLVFPDFFLLFHSSISISLFLFWFFSFSPLNFFLVSSLYQGGCSHKFIIYFHVIFISVYSAVRVKMYVNMLGRK